MDRKLFGTGALLLLLGVGLGAFGAHALEGKLLPADLHLFELAVRYQLVHGVGLLGVAIAARAAPSPLLQQGGWVLLAGTLVFCGSLLLMAFGAPRWLGAITPVGGTGLILGWGLVMAGAWRRQ
ncbi:MAG: DUF423 domain-containing protein [Planctomycetota bacterium]